MLLQRNGPMRVMPPYSIVTYIIMQFGHFWGMHSLISGPLIYSSSSSPPATAAARFKLAMAAAASSDDCSAAAVPGAARPAARSSWLLLLRRWRAFAAEAPASTMSRALVSVAIVDLFFAAADPAGGARRGHVPRARWRRRCGRHGLVRCCRPRRSARRGHVCVRVAALKSLQGGSCRKHIKSCEILRHRKQT